MAAFSIKFSFVRDFDWTLPIVVFVLGVLGLAAIYSVDLSRGEDFVFFPTQLISFVLGFIIFFITSNIHPAFYQTSARFTYVIAVILLILVLIFGVSVRGTTGWFRIANISFQPSEFAKVAYILFLAWLIYKFGRRFDKWQFVIVTGLSTLLFVFLILLQPDFGTAIIFLGVWIGLLLAVRIKKSFIIIIFLLGISTMILGWFFLFEGYQRERILTFIDTSRDPLGGGYNVTQSIIAIGAGRIFGRGLGFGSQSQLHFLPEAQTDFIFSVIAEELGFLAAITVLALYFYLLSRFVIFAGRASDDFRSFTLLGIAVVFLVQIVLNIGAAVGILPITGVTLPFLSYGGSSFIMNCLLVGIAESIMKSIKQKERHVLST